MLDIIILKSGLSLLTVPNLNVTDLKLLLNKALGHQPLISLSPYAHYSAVLSVKVSEA